VGDLKDRKIRTSILAAAKRPDLVVGGPPCQGWSYAGWHMRADPRNALVWTFIAMVSRLKPKALIMENVQGLIWMTRGQALTSIKAAIENLGYTVSHFVLNSADFGVPQRRIRVFIVGTRGGLPPKPPRPLFRANDLLLPPPITVQEAIGDLPTVSAGERSEEIPWTAPQDNVPYRDWCRGSIDFEAMYSRILHRFQHSKQASFSTLEAKRSSTDIFEKYASAPS
jgi:DNA (cytosine-5)-methyltransferase 1